MRHLTLVEHGHFLGLTGNRIVIRASSEVVAEYPLSRLRTVSIAKKGVSISSDLMLALAQRGIKLFVLDWRNVAVAALSGVQQHAVAAIRKAQFAALSAPDVWEIPARVLYGKIRNQRAVLLYFSKYQKRVAPDIARQLQESALKLKLSADRLRHTSWENRTLWREEMMGVEGAAAASYWSTLRQTGLLPSSFPGRVGRAAGDITNQALNYGYTLLTSSIWHSLINTGLEVYAGLLHTQRPGKPALVLDLMEEYRPWCVDRLVIKMRDELKSSANLSPKVKQRITREYHQLLASRLPYNKKDIRLESIMQRQAYRLAASFLGKRTYRPCLFKW